MVDEATLELEVQRLRNELDDYRASVKGIYAFASSACWDESRREINPSSFVSIPRTMTAKVATDDDEPKHRNLTPDGVVQVSPQYGVVVEMKKHFRQGDTRKLEQIKSYDCNLGGWWTEQGLIADHDLVLLTHLFSSVDAKDAYDTWLEQGGSFDRNFAIVEFGHANQGQRWFLLRRVGGSGHLSDTDHDEALRKGKKLSEKALILTTQKYEFYDDKPPLIHMLVRIHQSALPALFSEEQFDSETEGAHPRITTSVHEVCDKLHELHCDTQDTERQPFLPKPAWVKEALDAYVRMGLGGRSEGHEDRYEIILRKPRDKDMVRFFARQLLAARKPQRAGRSSRTRGNVEQFGQRSLFGDLESKDDGREQDEPAADGSR